MKVIRTINMKYAITIEDFNSVESYRLNAQHSLQWNCVFVLPGWLKAWCQIFGNVSDPYLCVVEKQEDLIGIAPLIIEGEKASLAGDANICDYLDFIVSPKRGPEFCAVLLDYLSNQGITHLDLKPLRHDSIIFTDLVKTARELGYDVSCEQEDVSLELDLPPTWDDYLMALNGKQRHEVRRKLRRLHETAAINFRVFENAKDIRNIMPTFFALFEQAKENKAAFMTERMASFFNSLAEAMAEAGMIKIFLLELDAIPAAASMCFDYNSTIYLYNSGYDQQFNSLGVGLLCKVLSIKASIQRGRIKYDFLKGSEAYKHRLGGKEIPIYRCKIDW